jgi:peptide chain release factor 1
MKFSLDNLITEYESLETELADPTIYADLKRLKSVNQKKKSLEKTVTLYREYKTIYANYDEAKTLVTDEKDPEMLEMMKLEIAESEKRIPELEEALKIALLPTDPNDEKNIILEIRAWAGWDEAGLFAHELAEAYKNFSKKEGYSLEVMSETWNDAGGYKEGIFKIEWGAGAYARFKYESGVHRVQRIPQTEKNGRVHTSTTTVAVMPEVEDVDVTIREEDLEIIACRASGAGGQHVNKTNSAIRVVHIPTGLVAECQNERSQLQNKLTAISVLKSRIHAMEEEKKNQAEWALRLAQVGTGDRSEKIRTYNFPQDRITDHRINANFSNLPTIMMGNLTDIFDALAIADQTAQLEAAAGNSR